MTISNVQKELELFIPDLKKTFELETDASDTGIGGVLRQDTNLLHMFQEC
jgi:hypothetical protein